MIAAVYAEGRLIRGDWARTDEQGRQLLCLYTALVGDPAARPDTCPADRAPQWLAHLLPWIDDAGTAEHWPAVVERVARPASSFGRLPPSLEWTVRGLCASEATRRTDVRTVVEALGYVADLCELRGLGRRVTDEDLQEASDRVGWACEEMSASSVAAHAAAAAVVAATDPAANSVVSAAEWATATTWAADRLIDAILDAIEHATKEAA